MEFVDYYGDDRLRHKIVFNRNSYSECIYCGEIANTREHIPSKVFLAKPYPENLGIVPACQECNNSYSNDELLLSILIEKLKSTHLGQGYNPIEEVQRRMDYNEKLVKDIEKAIENKNLNEFDKKIKRILLKLAIGHSVYELSEGYCIKDGIVDYSFLDNMSVEEIEEFSLPFNIGGELLPEIGSRVYERMIVLELSLADVHDPGQRLVLLDWVDVQESKYTYTSYRFGNDIVVKMIINDFMYAKVVINSEIV